MPIASVARIAALGVNILLVSGGLVPVIWQSLEKSSAVVLYEAAGGYAGNDVTRGYYIGIVGGLGITLLAVTSLVCSLGIIFAIATHLLLPDSRKAMIRHPQNVTSL
ncbi:hypothetical protein [Arthrobacter cryoconiti]|uniref:Uncharacterized protein n=1 Tax=Arthrobacter cryoconiti TaxID=748907 RepID=A0ABV8QY50_9MICC|nr:hypothetical protein [Arthrobacter cryoconiti]MCC9068173.1 hypothetical protein [Arthrobacter cryoconiti]